MSCREDEPCEKNALGTACLRIKKIHVPETARQRAHTNTVQFRRPFEVLPAPKGSWRGVEAEMMGLSPEFREFQAIGSSQLYTFYPAPMTRFTS